MVQDRISLHWHSLQHSITMWHYELKVIVVPTKVVWNHLHQLLLWTHSTNLSIGSGFLHQPHQLPTMSCPWSCSNKNIYGNLLFMMVYDKKLEFVEKIWKRFATGQVPCRYMFNLFRWCSTSTRNPSLKSTGGHVAQDRPSLFLFQKQSPGFGG